MKLTEKIALNSSVQAVRQVLLAVFGIVSIGLVTRYLSVDQYGGVLAALVLLSLFSFAADFGISAMTVRAMAREPEDELAIQNSAFWAWVAFTIPTALLIFAIAQFAYPGPEHETTRQSVLILLTTFPLAPFGGVAVARAMADQRVWVISVASICARALALCAIGVVVVLDLGPLGIAAAFASGYVLEEAFSILFVRPSYRLGLGWNRGRIWQLIAAAVPLGTILIINGLYFRLDAFLLSILGTERDLAVYGVAYKAFETLLSLPGFVMITLLPVLAKLDFDQPRYSELVQKAFTGMCILALPIFGFSLLGQQAMVALAGPRYAEGGLVLTLIMCSVGIACLQGVFGNALVAQGKQGVLLRVAVAVLVVNGLINLAAIPLFGDTGAASALVFSELLSLGLTLIIYRRLAPLPRFHMPVRLLLALGALVLAATACLAIPDAVTAMAAGVAAGLIAYIGTLLALRAVPSYVSQPFVSAIRSIRPGGAT